MLKQPKDSDSSGADRQQIDRESNSFWECSVGELLERVASTNPTPGGGSCATIVACMGAALLRKAFAVSLKKEPAGSRRPEELKVLMEKLDGHASVLQKSADRDAAAFEDYLRAVRQPQRDAAEAELRKDAIEATTVAATAVPLAATSEIRQIVVLALHHLPLVNKVLVSDALVGLRLVLASATCLLTTAEDNLSGLTDSASFASLNTQLRDLTRLMAESEQELEQHLAAVDRSAQ
jgi:formiminotetrahydrofolate cyclodeaminase